MSSNKFRKKTANGKSIDHGVTDPHREREGNRYEQPIASREFITSTLRGEPGPVDFEALADILQLTGDDVAMEALRRRVGAMIRDGQLIQNRRRGLLPVDEDKLLAGRIVAHPDGFGFVVTDDNDKDIFLNGKQMRRVLHGDKVVVCVTGVDRRGRREGRIVDVVERANQSLVGRLSIDRGTVVVLPDNKRIHQDLLIAPGELASAVDGDMVVAEIVEQPTQRHQPVGKIVEVLGQHLRPGMEIDVALHSHGIPDSWPEDVLEQAAAFSTTVDSAAAQDRKDVRDLPLVTIDGADARDFDDAVWCEALPEGWRLLVAIADVAHYVVPESPLDVEAIKRGTSVYFPGRVVPMLPEVLSNGLCSLNPEVDRLCMICEMTLTSEGDVKKTRFHNGILRSHARLTYDGVSEMLTSSSSPLRKQFAAVLPVIEELHKLYKVLAKVRRKRGAIEFDSNETYIEFDEHKKIKQIVPVQRNDAHKLIEECMILANIQAAAYLEEREIPALYRVHAGPKADRLEDLRAFLSLRSLSLGGGDSPSALDYAALSAAIQDRPDRSVIQTVMLRSMQQAVYQPANQGHFGLALEQYAHFTSPIRRYPDLLVHRALKFAISKGKLNRYTYSKEAMVAFGESCSVTERRAEDASRDVVSWLKCEYMQDHIGAEFDGVISAVTAFGLFIELPDIHVEGLLHVTNLSRDYYKHDAAAQAMTGERTGRQYRLGDSIRVQVAGVNLEERKIDFAEAESAAQDGRKSGAESRKRKKHKPKSAAHHDTISAQPAAPQRTPEEQAESAERRRQKKRKLKQKRRDRKRAERHAAKHAQTPVASTAKHDASLADVQSAVSPDSQKQPPMAEAQTEAASNKKDAASKKVSSEKSSDKKGATTTAATKKKTAQKKAAGRKVTSEKNTVKESTGKKVAGKKVAGKKVISKKATSKKATSKKVAGKKVAGKKAAVKKVAAKKVSTKKTAAAKALSSVASGKKVVARKVVARKTASGKATAKTHVSAKAATSKPVARKKAAAKAVEQTLASQSAVSEKTTSKKTTNKKTSSKKTTGKKTSRKNTAISRVSNKSVTGKKMSGKKTVAKNAVSKVANSKKKVSKKATAKKASAKKTSGKRTVSKKKTTKKKV